MMRRSTIVFMFCVAGELIAAHAAGKPQFQTLYNFQRTGPPPVSPDAPLLGDKAGNLYGTTQQGGTGQVGTVFKLAPDGTFTVLHNFGDGDFDGQNSAGSLVQDKAGNLFGTTYYGGEFLCGDLGCGTVFEITPDGTESVVHQFEGEARSDGEAPYAGLIADRSGNLYGTTAFGGSANCDPPLGCGTIFRLAKNGAFTELYAFKDGTDGAFPFASLLIDSDGNLYGTTSEGGGSGCNSQGCGTIFKLAPDGKESVLYTFTGGNDGSMPYAGLIIDSAGNLYGTTLKGGGKDVGVVFKLTPTGTETVLHSFSGGRDGRFPHGALLTDRRGTFYGTTWYGGSRSQSCHGGCGTIFKITPDGHEKIIHVFSQTDGAIPTSALIADKSGHLYGTTFEGGQNGGGTIFEITP